MGAVRLNKANSIIRNVFKRAADLNIGPLAAVVLCDGGHLKALQSQDGATFLKSEIARAKAYASLGSGLNSSQLHQQAVDRPHHAAALAAITAGSYMPVGGGVIIKNKNGQTIGAVGVSGATSEQDEQCAIWAIEQSGLNIS